MRDGCLVQNVIDACLLRGTLWYVCMCVALPTQIIEKTAC